MLSRRQALASFAALGLLGCRREREFRPEHPPEPGPGKLLIRAKVHTGDPARPEAEGVLIRGPEILLVGSADELDAAADADTERFDWRDTTLIPGLTDARAHLLGLGQGEEIVDLRGASSVAEIIARIQDQAPPEGWILGRGWDQNLWGGAMPTAAELDAAFGERPVWLRRVDGHAGWANSVVLHLAEIDGSTANPEGGEILRDAEGQATGVLVDSAMDRVPVPEPSAADITRWLVQASRRAASLGLTGVHEMGVPRLAHQALTKLAEAQALPIRIHAYASEAWWNEGLDDLRPAALSPDAHYHLAGVKVYADGALGSRGAALIEPYADRPDHRGALMHPPAYFEQLFTAILERGFQVATHAIGDLGNRTTIEAYAKALAAVPSQTDARLRIEHLQIVDPADIPRMAELGLVASMQPTHATSDMPWVEARIGADRMAGAYAWRRVLDAGVPLAFGSDFPVERPSPLLGLYSAVIRQDLDGQPEGGWLGDQRLNLAEAIAGFSAGAAHAAHREDHLGKIAPGYRADLTVVDGDLFAREPAELPDLSIRGTVVDGLPSF